MRYKLTGKKPVEVSSDSNQDGKESVSKDLFEKIENSFTYKEMNIVSEGGLPIEKHRNDLVRLVCQNKVSVIQGDTG